MLYILNHDSTPRVTPSFPLQLLDLVPRNLLALRRLQQSGVDRAGGLPSRSGDAHRGVHCPPVAASRSQPANPSPALRRPPTNPDWK